LAGDKFKNAPVSPTGNPLAAPFTHSVSSVGSSTNLTVSPAITVLENEPLIFTRANGNLISIISSDCSQVDNVTVELKAKIAIVAFGDAGVDYNLNLSNIISYTP